MADDRKAHWEEAYTAKSENEVSWYQGTPAPSLDLLGLVDAKPASAVVDIGGGASRLVDSLVDAGYVDLTVLDLSDVALKTARTRLGNRGDAVKWIVADVTRWQPPKRYDVWHDRAAFHFLTAAADQQAYVERLRDALVVGGHVIIATFAPDGPERCSGLPVARHDAASIGALLGPDFECVDTRRHDHQTPWDTVQKFQFSTFRRNA